MKPVIMPVNGHELLFGGRTLIMGVLNVTPDSFSDGGLFRNTETALGHARAMLAAGADIIDIGGESTRPFADPVSEQEEAERVIPVIKRLAADAPCPISIDTMRASVAQQALDAGAGIINNVSALRADPRMGEVAARNGAPVVLMHMAGTPKTMQVEPHYKDVVSEVRDFLAQAIERAQAAGVDRNKIIIDPGIGFGKTIAHNLLLIRHLDVLRELGVPVLLGPSRKKFIRALLTPDNGPEPEPMSFEVETGTQAVLTAAALQGVEVMRVHDVEIARSTLRVADAIRMAETP